jgi:hypothetical protein
MRDRMRLASAEAADLEEARALSDSKSLERRLEEALQWAALSVLEIARTAADEADLARKLEGDFPPSLRERWDARKRR